MYIFRFHDQSIHNCSFWQVSKEVTLINYYNKILNHMLNGADDMAITTFPFHKVVLPYIKVLLVGVSVLESSSMTVFR